MTKHRPAIKQLPEISWNAIAILLMEHPSTCSESFRSESLMNFNLRLSHKINSIAALGIAGLLVLGGVYFAGNASQDAARGRDDNARSLRELQGKVFDTILKLRRAEKDFLLRKEEKYVQLHHKLSEEVKVDLAEMQHQAAAFGHADLRDELSAIQSGYTSYLQHFTRLSDARIRLGLK